MPASPSTDNYYVGKGIVSFKGTDDPDYVDCGNCSAMEITLTTTVLDHFSSREGVKKKDKQIILERSGTVKLTLDELSARNIAMAFMGTEAAASGGTTIGIFDKNEIVGALKYMGTNEVGPQMDIEINNVTFRPGASFNPISDEWGEIELDGEMLVDAYGEFGTINHRDPP